MPGSGGALICLTEHHDHCMLPLQFGARLLAPKHPNAPARMRILWNQHHTCRMPDPATGVMIITTGITSMSARPWKAGFLRLPWGAAAGPFVCYTYLDSADGRSSQAWPSGHCQAGLGCRSFGCRRLTSAFSSRSSHFLWRPAGRSC